MLRAALLVPFLALAACNGHGDGNTTISIKADDEGGNVSLSTDKEGRAAIKAPGFEGSIKLPKIDISAEDFDVNGVKLYPNSKIRNLDINASHGDGASGDKVAVSFESPASLAKVQGWFRDRMAEHGFRTSADGNGFKGTTGEGDPFAIELNAAGADKVEGRLTVADRH